MSFNDFLNGLLRLSRKKFKHLHSPDECFEQLLLNNVLPFASRRSPDSIDVHLRDPEIVYLKNYFQYSLFDLYSFYASAADERRRKDTSSSDKINLVNTMKEVLDFNLLLLVIIVYIYLLLFIYIYTYLYIYIYIYILILI